MAKKKRGRYGSHIRKHKYDGYTFDSKKEMVRYMELKLLQKGNAIGDLKVHPRIDLILGGVPIRTDTGRIMAYIADFRYYDWDKRTIVYEDVKFDSGYRDPVYRLKRAIVRAMGIEILET